MKILGVILIIISLVIGFFAFTMDVSVATNYGNRVVNFSLINQQKNYMYLSGLMLIVGLVLLLIKNSSSKIENKITENETTKNSKYDEVKTENGFNYKLPINENVTFQIIKEKILDFYSKLGFFEQINNDNTFFIKNDSTKAYIEVKVRENYINISIYNTEKPNFIDNLYNPITKENKDDKNVSLENIDKIIKLSKLLDKGLITEEEFISYRKTLSN